MSATGNPRYWLDGMPGGFIPHGSDTIGSQYWWIEGEPHRWMNSAVQFIFDGNYLGGLVFGGDASAVVGLFGYIFISTGPGLIFGGSAAIYLPSDLRYLLLPPCSGLDRQTLPMLTCNRDPSSTTPEEDTLSACLSPEQELFNG